MVCRLRCKIKVVAILPAPIDLKSLLPDKWQSLIDTSSLNQISQNLTGDFLPQRSNIFKAFECDPNSAHAMGLAFSVPDTMTTLPSSLKNIFLELKSDLGIERRNGDLSDWATQGVFLLNTCLTVLPNDPLAHTK